MTLAKKNLPPAEALNAKKYILRRAFNHDDASIGARVRAKRLLCGLSLLQLGQRIGVSYQQIQKYELGRNQFTIGRLYEIASALETPITYFLHEPPPQHGNHAWDCPLQGLPFMDFTNDEAEKCCKETGELIKLFYKIPTPKLRKEVLSLIKIMAGQSPAT
jgi:transcriptional regulator with XRE-family HTH domain